ncbi:MAG: hypothetical protein HKN12_04260, partial [Gemmatimonadetes bacterium]|nr:hypothetical protein [Gemmatimonadota bacterium]
GGLRVVLWILAIFTNVTSVQRMVLVVSALVRADRPAGDDVEEHPTDPEPDPVPAPRG